jgi:hypothetical protein
MSRDCDAIGCKTPTASGKFMCLRHWRMVPLEIQRTINDRYRALRRDFAFLHDVAYLQACVSAIDGIAEAEAMLLVGREELLPNRIVPGLKVRTLRGELDESQAGNSRLTPAGSWGWVARPNAPGEWHVFFPNGAAVVITDSELRDPDQYDVLPVNPYRRHLVLAEQRASKGGAA